VKSLQRDYSTFHFLFARQSGINRPRQEETGDKMSVLKVAMKGIGEDEIWFLTRPSVRNYRKVVLVQEEAML